MRPAMVSVKKLSRIFVIGVLSVIVVLLGLELGVRILRPQRTFVSTVNTWDPDVGTRQIPGARGFVICPEYEIDLIINSKGLRDREYPYEKPEGTRRILCLGDSFVCGYGVEAEDTFAKVLERLLNSQGGVGPWEVLNAGVGSTGTAHQLAYYIDEGHKYDADVVVVGFFVSNDFWDNALSGVYSLRDGSLVRTKAPLTRARKIQRYTGWIPGYDTLFARSHLLNLLKFKVAAAHFRRLSEISAEPQEQSDASRHLHELAIELVSELDRECRSNDCELIIMIIPPPPGSARPAGLDDFAERIGACGIQCLDLEAAFAEVSRREILNYKCDGHWNKRGHKLAAELLYDTITELLCSQRTLAPEVVARRQMQGSGIPCGLATSDPETPRVFSARVAA